MKISSMCFLNASQSFCLHKDAAFRLIVKICFSCLSCKLHFVSPILSKLVLGIKIWVPQTVWKVTSSSSCFFLCFYSGNTISESRKPKLLQFLKNRYFSGQCSKYRFWKLNQLWHFTFCITESVAEGTHYKRISESNSWYFEYQH